MENGADTAEDRAAYEPGAKGPRITGWFVEGRNGTIARDRGELRMFSVAWRSVLYFRVAATACCYGISKSKGKCKGAGVLKRNP